MTDNYLVFFPAPPAKRLAAYLFDRSLLYLSLIAISFIAILVMLPFGKDPVLVNQFLGRQEGSILALLLSACYFVYLEGSRGATFGKRVMSCHVVDTAGNAISYRRAAVRFMAASLNWLTLGLGLLVIFFRKDRRGLHDIVAGTWVVHDDPKVQKLRVFGKVIIALYFTVFLAALTVGMLVILELRRGI